MPFIGKKIALLKISITAAIIVTVNFRIVLRVPINRTDLESDVNQ